MSKIIVISGGGDGLGKVIAAQLLGHQIIILGRREDALKSTALEYGCDFEVCDISETKQIDNTVKKIETKYGKIDVLVNNAAVWIQGELKDNDTEQIQRAVNINLTGTILLTKAVSEVMRRHNDGLIININSQGGLYAKAERSIYTATKWGLTGFTKSIQPEFAQYGIRVTGLYPGKMKTGMFAKTNIQKDMSDALDPKEVAATIEFLVNTNSNVLFPEIGIKHINN